MTKKLTLQEKLVRKKAARVVALDNYNAHPTIRTGRALYLATRAHRVADERISGLRK